MTGKAAEAARAVESLDSEIEALERRARPLRELRRERLAEFRVALGPGDAVKLEGRRAEVLAREAPDSKMATVRCDGRERRVPLSQLDPWAAADQAARERSERRERALRAVRELFKSGVDDERLAAIEAAVALTPGGPSRRCGLADERCDRCDPATAGCGEPLGDAGRGGPGTAGPRAGAARG